jgi:riboflavin kinase / FMN adenylyltransferase
VTTAAAALWLDDVEPEPSVVTIGNFDGVHRGHRTLLHRTVDAALARGVRSIAVTFEPHPAAVLRPGSEPARLTSQEERAELLRDAGIDLVVLLPFTRELAALEPEAFIASVLAERLQATRVVVGTNFRFGRGAAGDVAVLVEEGDRHGFDVEAVAVRNLDEVAISSTSIRDALHRGDLAWASEALGRPYQLRGEVVRGDGRGRAIGIPTANLDVPAGRLVPPHGVYAGHASAGGTWWRCVTNVGVRPTFDVGDTPTVETHLIDAGDVDLYGQMLTVTFEHHLRGEQRFEGVEALIAQIRRDVDEARAWLDAHDARPEAGRSA